MSFIVFYVMKFLNIVIVLRNDTNGTFFFFAIGVRGLGK